MPGGQTLVPDPCSARRVLGCPREHRGRWTLWFGAGLPKGDLATHLPGCGDR